jgi:hypothetical protein
MDEQAATYVGGQIYYEVPSETWREIAENLFPGFAKDLGADAATGYFHRWQYGHDLALDLPKVCLEDGLGSAGHRAGHVILTDMPSHQGIPVPGFSKDGLGEALLELGVPRKMMCMNMFDVAGGGVLMIEATPDLINSISGNMPLTAANLMDTFGEGSIELALSTVAFSSPGGACYSPVILIASIENIAAGFAMIAHDIFTVVSLGDIVLGGGVASAVAGSVSLLVYRGEDKLNKTAQTALKSFTIGGAYAMSSAAALGLLGAYISFSSGSGLAQLSMQMHDANLAISVDDVPCDDLPAPGTECALILENEAKSDLFHDVDTTQTNIALDDVCECQLSGFDDDQECAPLDNDTHDYESSS